MNSNVWHFFPLKEQSCLFFTYATQQFGPTERLRRRRVLARLRRQTSSQAALIIRAVARVSAPSSAFIASSLRWEIEVFIRAERRAKEDEFVPVRTLQSASVARVLSGVRVRTHSQTHTHTASPHLGFNLVSHLLWRLMVRGPHLPGLFFLQLRDHRRATSSNSNCEIMRLLSRNCGGLVNLAVMSNKRRTVDYRNKKSSSFGFRISA